MAGKTSWLLSELLEAADYGKSKILRREIGALPLFPDLLLSRPRQLQVAEVQLKEVWPALCKTPLRRGSKKSAVAMMRKTMTTIGDPIRMLVASLFVVKSSSSIQCMNWRSQDKVHLLVDTMHVCDVFILFCVAFN